VLDDLIRDDDQDRRVVHTLGEVSESPLDRAAVKVLCTIISRSTAAVVDTPGCSLVVAAHFMTWRIGTIGTDGAVDVSESSPAKGLST
jgi:hypothetical protein